MSDEQTPDVPPVDPATIPETTKSEVVLRVVAPWGVHGFVSGADPDVQISRVPTVVKNKTTADRIIQDAADAGITIEKVS